MSDTPRTDAMASEVEHLGSGGRALYQGRLWSLAYALESELTATCAKRDALRTELLEVAEAMNGPAVNNIRTLAESIRILQAERDALLEVLELAVESGCATVFANEDDECGERGCCGVVSYKPHADDCWVTKARAAIDAAREKK